MLICGLGFSQVAPTTNAYRRGRGRGRSCGRAGGHVTSWVEKGLPLPLTQYIAKALAGPGRKSPRAGGRVGWISAPLFRRSHFFPPRLWRVWAVREAGGSRKGLEEAASLASPTWAGIPAVRCPKRGAHLIYSAVDDTQELFCRGQRRWRWRWRQERIGKGLPGPWLV